METLAVIPARGGSKSVPRKNIRSINGKPLIAHTIESALSVGKLFSAVIVSTEDADIASISQAAGAIVPFHRPLHLAKDDTPTLSVAQHATKFMEQRCNIEFDCIMILQPTSPLRTKHDIEESIRLIQMRDYDSVISVVDASDIHPYKAMVIEHDRLEYFIATANRSVSRQGLRPKAYMSNGAIYLVRRSILMETNSIRGKSICPYIMPPERSIDIDSEVDLITAELLMKLDSS